LRNHAPEVAAIDFFVVPTIDFTCSLPSLSSSWVGFGVIADNLINIGRVMDKRRSRNNP
jgi:hypothetical protein